VATRTVETHLTSVFRKLHITTRSQLPAELDRAEPCVAGIGVQGRGQ
jgi:DNA-binding NarL/FixJ family response regulator